MIRISDREFRFALRRRKNNRTWDCIADEIGNGMIGDDLRAAVTARQLRDAGARQTLAARPRLLPSIAIGRTADGDVPHQNRGAMARRIRALRMADHDPLDDLIHPSVFRP